MQAISAAAADALASLLREAALDDMERDWEASDGASGAETSTAALGDMAPPDLPPAAAARLNAARLRAASAELGALQQIVRDKDHRLSSLEAELQALRQESVGWVKDRKALEAKAERASRAAEAAVEQLRLKEELLRSVEQERRTSVQERRSSQAEIKAREARLAHALEEAASYRRLLEEAREAAQARQAVPREEHARVLAENRTLAGQKQELVLAFGKAMKLVGVLEQQKVHLQAGLELAA